MDGLVSPDGTVRIVPASTRPVRNSSCSEAVSAVAVTIRRPPFIADRSCVHYLLSQIPCPYREAEPVALMVPKRQEPTGYVRPQVTDQAFVPEVY